MPRSNRNSQNAIAMALAVAASCGWTGAAPIPHSVAHSFVSPSTARQTNTYLGYSTAIDGTTMLLGSPFNDIGGEDNGVVWIHSSATGALLHRLDNPSPGNRSNFGWSVAISGSRVVIGVPEDNTGAPDAGVVYVYDLASATPSIPVLVLTNPNPAANDNFGWSVAISGTRVVVGTPDGDSGLSDAGYAYVYDIVSATPDIPVLQLGNPDPAGKNFGHSVAVAGSKVVVGSIQDSGAGDASRAYVYDLASGTPGEPAHTLSDASPASNEQFGFAVAISGSKVIVTAPLHDTGAVDAGAAYAYDLTSGTPAVPVATLPNPTPALSDTFGLSASISGNRVVIGASLDDQGASDSGRTYLFDLLSGTPTVPAVTFENPGPQFGDQFGHAVAISGSRLIVSAISDNTTGVSDDVGSAYVYEVSSGTPGTPVITLNNVSPSSFEEFGSSVAISGSLVAVGSRRDDIGIISNAGTVILYDMTSPVPTQPSVVIGNPTPATSDFFGASVSASGTLVAVGAFQDDTGAQNAGSVYLYDAASPTPSVPVQTLQNPDQQPGDQFGNSVAISGQLLAVGCSKNDVGGFLDAGTVYVYDLSSATPTVPWRILDNPAPAPDDWFGFSVAISGTTVVVGAHQNDIGVTDSGSAYVYDLLSGTATTPIAILDNPAPAADDEFGYSVAVSGPKVVVGSRLDDSGAVDAGSAHIYDLNSGTPAVPVAALSHPDAEDEDYFGVAVAISGTRIVVGASEDDAAAEDAGCCYVYDLGSATFPEPADRLQTLNLGDGDWFGNAVAADGTNILVGAPFHDGNTEDRGAAYVFDPDPPAPQLQVEQPPGTGLIGGEASIHFGNAPVGSQGSTQVVVIRNVGTSALQVTSASIYGGSQEDFSVGAPTLPAILQVDETLQLDVSFVPEVTGTLVSTLRIQSDAGNGNPFDVTLTGQALSAADDTDGDGINDVAELQMEAMGFDWQVNDEELLLVLQSGANATGLYSGEQLQAMNPDTPLLPMDPATGQFRLTLAVEKSADLIDFSLFPMETGQAPINGAGGADFQFDPPGSRAFFRISPY